LAKQFYFAHDADNGRTKFNSYHTHVTCPTFRGPMTPKETTEEAIMLIPKCSWCRTLDSKRGDDRPCQN
jgi:hypothetical protein